LPSRFEEKGVCFILITRSGVEEMKSERQREKDERLEIGAITTLNDSRRPVRPVLPLVPPFLRGGKKRTREKPFALPSASLPLMPFASPKLPRFTTDSQL
jgi:hypothetical protein